MLHAKDGNSGTLTGAVYAANFPSTVGRFVLDGVASTNIVGSLLLKVTFSNNYFDS